MRCLAIPLECFRRFLAESAESSSDVTRFVSRAEQTRQANERMLLSLDEPGLLSPVDRKSPVVTWFGNFLILIFQNNIYYNNSDIILKQM